MPGPPFIFIRSIPAGRSRVRLWIRRGVLLGVPLTLLLLTIAAQHRPTWHKPVSLTSGDLERARAEGMSVWDDVSWKIVSGQTFEMSLADRALNEWFAALRHDRPELVPIFPEQIRELHLSFQNASVRVSALLESRGWRAIVSLDIQPRLSSDRDNLELRCTGAYVGSLPVPTSWLVSSSTRFATKLGEQFEPEPALADGLGGLRRKQTFVIDNNVLRITNRFVWPNGERPFKLVSIEHQPGTVRLAIEPL